MRRIVSVWFPEFPVERFIRGQAKRGLEPPVAAGEPFALAESGAKGLRLAACNRPARGLGLHEGQRLADARAMVPDLVSQVHEPHRDAESLMGIARWAERYSPWVALDPPDGLVLDIAGCAHLLGGEDAMLADIRARLGLHGFTARIAAAATIGAAWALARHRETCLSEASQNAVIAGLVPATHSAARASLRSRGAMGPRNKSGDDEFGGIRDELSPLPVEALRIAPEAALMLRRLGLKTIGDLMILPRSSLARRFRSETIPENVLLRLDQALGARDEVLSPLSPPPRFSVRLAPMEPLVSAESLEAALVRLIQALTADLAKAGHGATRLTLRLFRTDGSRLSLPAGLTQPSQDASHLLRLLRPKLEPADAGFGIDAMTLDARETAVLALGQAGFMEDSHDTGLAHLADRVINRHGGAALGVLRVIESHIPERAEILSSPRRGEVARNAPEGGRGEGNAPARPLLIFDRPEPAAVIAAVPDGPPLRFTWRRVARRVTRSTGPERIAPEWWRLHMPDARPRDYYLIEDEHGRRYWLYREGLYGEDAARPNWFVHGLSA